MTAVNQTGKNLPALNDAALKAEVTENQNYVRLKYEHLHTHVRDNWRDFTRALPICHPTKGPWIAGGAVRRFLMNTRFQAAHVDYFCLDKQQHHLTCARLESLDAVLTHENKYHRTYRHHDLSVQIIRSRFCSSLEQHLEEFDFRICQTGWDGEAFLVSLGAFKDLLSKELNVTGKFHNPLGSLIRMVKYYKQEFTPTPACVAALLEAGKDVVDTSETYGNKP